MSRGRWLILLVVVVVFIATGGAVAWLVMHHNAVVTASAGATPDKTEHHGMSPALWVAISTAIWVPLIAGAARRKRTKKALQGRQL